MNRIRLIVALGFVNLGLFVTTAAFLPRPSSFSWSTGNPLSYLINSRTRWDIAWLVLVASILASVGVYLFITAVGPQLVIKTERHSLKD